MQNFRSLRRDVKSEKLQKIQSAFLLNNSNGRVKRKWNASVKWSGGKERERDVQDVLGGALGSSRWAESERNCRWTGDSFAGGARVNVHDDSFMSGAWINDRTRGKSFICRMRRAKTRGEGRRRRERRGGKNTHLGVSCIRAISCNDNVSFVVNGREKFGYCDRVDKIWNLEMLRV